MNASGQRWNVGRRGPRVKNSMAESTSPVLKTEQVDTADHVNRSSGKLETSREKQSRDSSKRLTGVPMQRRKIPELAVNQFDHRRNQAPQNVTLQN